MANRSVQLYLYAKLPGIGWRYRPAVFGANNKPKPNLLLCPDERAEHHPEADYYLGYRNGASKVWENVGNNPSEALKALHKKRTGLAHVAAGGTVLGEQSVAQPQRTRLIEAIDEWLEIINETLSKDSYDAKNLVMREFLDSYRKKPKPRYVEDITRVDALRYVNTWLKQQGNDDRTRWNKFLHLRQFLSEHDHNVFKKDDAPKYGRRDPEPYTDEQVSDFFSKCNPFHHVLFSVLYCCGLRFGEILTLRWIDINFKERFIHIDERPEYEWKPKKWHIRDIPIPPELLADLLKLKAIAKHLLLFPTKGGKPMYKMLDKCKRIAIRAGMEKHEAWLHKWRATYCVELLREGVDLPSIQALMGHKDMETTARYCAPLKKLALRRRLDEIKSFDRKRNVLLAPAGANKPTAPHKGTVIELPNSGVAVIGVESS
jgi:integrase